MQLSPEQDRALDAIARWRTSDRQTFVMAGYAGTGKTTLLQYFINQQSDLVTCLAPTGKAAAVRNISVVPPGKNIDITSIDLNRDTMRAIVDAYNLVESLV